ncbi:flagellin [Tabrizicola piscis]|uniref:Flagellin n=1 Tax=Tabrizicola piscis TaxID=2494374 RepID=A0A3S8U783_9RHOB|nr:flagellin [Tabrizicola piscis]AZL59464.1 flagellin [Tabrizicola piscis]
MSSILTNTSAMVALQTMKGITSNLNKTQSDISTGKNVASAKDNAAVWAISKVMESDVKGFKGISDSLALGGSTIAVARKAAETVTDLLTEVKGKIIAAQEENVDRGKIQTDIEQLTGQIASVVGAAQFNGLNMIDGSSTEAVNILSSLSRDSTGNVTAGQIVIERQSLSVTTPVSAQAFGTGTLTDNDTAEAYLNSTGATGTLFDGTAYQADGSDFETIADGASNTITIGQVAAGISYEVRLGEVAVNVVGGGSSLGSRTFQYVASAEDGTAEVAKNLASQINAFFGAATEAGLGYSATVSSTNPNQITITNGAAGGTVNTSMTLGLRATTGGTPGAAASGSGLGALSNIDVTTDTGATGALASIEGLIQTGIDAAAAFGSSQKRIEIQSDFVSSLTDSLKTGIGALVDTDMEEASARLQALQVQQQLATQALSIANQQPQSLLSLFR